MATENFNKTPYWDDYDEEKGFYRILFRPGHAVQARELTQLQTALQKQIEHVGTHLFKEGARVLDATFSYTNELHSVKLNSLFNAVSVDDYLEQYVNLKLKGETSGVTANVITYTKSDINDPPTLYVEYTSAGYDKTTTTFIDGEKLVTTEQSVYTYNANVPSLQTASLDCAKISTSAAVESGVYFVLGHFVYLPVQRIIISKYNQVPTARIGLKVIEKIVDADADSTLLDNAQGTPNFAAPGAHRYYIGLELKAVDPDEVINEDNFIELERVVLGRVVGKVRTSEYSVLEENLAKRTYDTNGNFIVNPLKLSMRESVRTITNNGIYSNGQTTDQGLIA